MLIGNEKLYEVYCRLAFLRTSKRQQYQVKSLLYGQQSSKAGYAEALGEPITYIIYLLNLGISVNLYANYQDYQSATEYLISRRNVL